jgi:hypothetical protein
MSKRILLSTAMVALTLATALPAQAQQADQKGAQKGEGAQSRMQANSVSCRFTYFSNSADSLDFQGSSERRCFDMKGGNDVLILNKADFPGGVDLYTGSGRDTAWTTDADDLVHDADGRDKEIRTYGGNDRIEIDLPIDDDPNRGVEVTERTVIKPGSGDNVIAFGLAPYSNAFARYSPDIWLTTENKANDSVKGVCGRPSVMSGFDIRSLEVPETSSVSYDIHGCNVGVFGLYGDANIDMTGGRLALQTYSEGFRVPDGENFPKITGEIKGGLGLTLDLSKTAPDSDFHWEGSGSAFVRSKISTPGSGGSFRVRSAREIGYQGDMAAGDVLFDLVAKGSINLDLVAKAGGGSNHFNLVASRMDVSWRLAGDGGFPEIVNDTPVTYLETSFVEPDIDWEAPQDMTEAASALASIKQPDKATIRSLPRNVPDIEVATTEVTVKPGNTRLRLQLRRDNDRFGKCVTISLVDLDGELNSQTKKCQGLNETLERLLIEDATRYELIMITGDGVDISIPINASSRFVVNRLEAEL